MKNTGVVETVEPKLFTKEYAKICLHCWNPFNTESVHQVSCFQCIQKYIARLNYLGGRNDTQV